jgi:NADPH-dependent ferric siderophore reductase
MFGRSNVPQVQHLDTPPHPPASVEHGPFGEIATATIEHINDEHDDTVTLMGRVLCDEPGARAAALTGVDHEALYLSVVTSSGASVARRVAFLERAESVEDAQLQFYALIALARQGAGDQALTSLERELAGITMIPTHITEVVDVVDINPRLRQITVQGGLGRFQPLAPDQFVYVLAPPHGTTQLTIDQHFSWEAYEAMPEHERPVGAYYTVRRWHPDTGSIDLWVVLHGHDGDGERWARNVRVGDPVALWGPRHAYDPPPGTDSFLLVGDETALPAIAAILEQLDAAATATVVIATSPETTPLELSSEATLDVHWLSIDQGADTSPLLRAVGNLVPAAIGTSTYLWGGAESHEVTALRRLVRDALGVPREQVSLTGYWRRSGGSSFEPHP